MSNFKYLARNTTLFGLILLPNLGLPRTSVGPIAPAHREGVAPVPFASGYAYCISTMHARHSGAQLAREHMGIGA